MRELLHLSDKLKDPEYLHLLLEPLMIYGLAIGVVVFLFSFFFGERKMQLVALGLVMVSALAVVPYLDQRRKADERVVKLRSEVEEMIAQSQERRADSRGAYLVVAGLAGLTLLMGAHKGKPGMFAGIATSLAGAAVVVHGAWLHLKDAEIYHPNIRVSESATGGGAPPAAAPADAARPKTRQVSVRPDEGRAARRALPARPSAR